MIVATHRQRRLDRLIDLEAANQLDLLLAVALRPDPVHGLCLGRGGVSRTIEHRVAVERLPWPRPDRFPLDLHRSTAMNLQSDATAGHRIGCPIGEGADGGTIDLMSDR